MKNYTRLPMLGAIAAILLLIPSCELDHYPGSGGNGGNYQVLEMDFYALAGGIMIDKYSTSNPENLLNSASITGLQTNEKILSIDFRPATGQLYGLGSTSRLYVIDPDTGAARSIGAAPFTPALTGTIAGFDFNPTVDRIRVVTSTGQNLRLNPETGTVASVDLDINGGSGPSISAVAYTTNTAGAGTTVLYDIDVNSRKLYKQLPPNDGTLVEVGNLNLPIYGEGGFDISYQNDIALGLFAANNKSTLFVVNLSTGKANKVAKYSRSLMYTGIAIPTQPVAYAVTAANNLLIFNPQNPSAMVSKPISGLSSGETVLGLDFRPINGQLYALGSTSRLYTINASSGVAVAAGAVFTTPLSGTDFGVDFNPLVDRFRIVSNTGQNLRVNPADGAVTVDLALNPGTPQVSAAAYTNNFAGTATTALFDIDVNTDKLYQQNPPNNGTLIEIGDLGVNVTASSGFDIGGKSGKAYSILTSGSSTSLYEINLTTGAAAVKASFSSAVTGFTVGLGF